MSRLLLFVARAGMPSPGFATRLDPLDPHIVALLA
jgi:hypothetical protein